MTSKKREELKKTFEEVFNLSAGNVSVACKKIGISRNTFYKWQKEDPEFEEAMSDVKESLIDMAETMLMKKVKDGSTAELIFFLKTIGKQRGYVETQELKHSGNTFIIDLPEIDD